MENQQTCLDGKLHEYFASLESNIVLNEIRLNETSVIRLLKRRHYSAKIQAYKEARDRLAHLYPQLAEYYAH